MFFQIGPRTLLSIPKAILRKTGPKRWRAEPQVHNYYSRAGTSAVDTTIKRPEMEDQTVTTVLEPEGLVEEDDRYWTIRNGVVPADRNILHQTTKLQKSGMYSDVLATLTKIAEFPLRDFKSNLYLLYLNCHYF